MARTLRPRTPCAICGTTARGMFACPGRLGNQEPWTGVQRWRAEQARSSNAQVVGEATDLLGAVPLGLPSADVLGRGEGAVKHIATKLGRLEQRVVSPGVGKGVKSNEGGIFTAGYVIDRVLTLLSIAAFPPEPVGCYTNVLHQRQWWVGRQDRGSRAGGLLDTPPREQVPWMQDSRGREPGGGPGVRRLTNRHTQTRRGGGVRRKPAKELTSGVVGRTKDEEPPSHLRSL